jgi:hypothetical protein
VAAASAVAAVVSAVAVFVADVHLEDRNTKD